LDHCVVKWCRGSFLLLQSNRRRSMFPEPMSSSVHFPSITHDTATDSGDGYTATEQIVKTGTNCHFFDEWTVTLSKMHVSFVQTH